MDAISLENFEKKTDSLVVKEVLLSNPRGLCFLRLSKKRVLWAKRNRVCNETKDIHT